MGLNVCCLGFTVWGLRHDACCLGFRVQGNGLAFKSVGSKLNQISDLGSRLRVLDVLTPGCCIGEGCADISEDGG